VEVAERCVDAFNRRDIEALLDLATPDCVMSSQLLDAGADFRGREGLERFYALLGESWDEFGSAVEEYRDLGDRVLILARTTGRGKGSGVTVEAPTGTLLNFRDGKVSRIRLYLDQGEALQAAGIAEEAMSEESTTPDLVALSRRTSRRLIVRTWTR
jgi:ketosteroid isomerase-like protein